ncbi:hypothetical protein BKA66DRAFT_428130 [Pyrenochaeta sp. MPI-SDFR-AT-0127]|nr:hypothetical protein BKA66DRAFT_428130 [Pyrenochaeta sp. MPI-SDFR-AT-0127]
MAEPISLASGLLTLVVFGFKSSTSLYQTIKGYNCHQRIVRELREELEDLSGALTSLNQAATGAEDDFTALKLPLLRCGNACKDFEAIIVKCSEHSRKSRTSFRDWARLKYMGDDITGFKNMLAGYKSTITIALCDAGLRTSAVTNSVLNEYQNKIEETMSDLTEHLLRVEKRLQGLGLQNSDSENEDEIEWRNLQSELESIQQCMDICTDVAAHIDSARPKVVQNIPALSDDQITISTTAVGTLARRDTEQLLCRCKDDLTNLFAQLNSRLVDLSQRQQSIPRHSKASEDLNPEKAMLQEEIKSVKQSLAICEEASEKARPDRTNVFEDVSMADDGHQVLVSTIGDLICARRIVAGARSIQWLGQMSDESLQQLSQGRVQNDSREAPKSEET